VEVASAVGVEVGKVAWGKGQVQTEMNQGSRKNEPGKQTRMKKSNLELRNVGTEFLHEGRKAREVRASCFVIFTSEVSLADFALKWIEDKTGFNRQ
jgi:hypothetical protein